MTEELLTAGNDITDDPTFDCSAIGFVRPCGAAAFASLCQHASHPNGGERVRLLNLRPNVYAYLDRIDFFARANAVPVNPPLEYGDLWNRNPRSLSVIELMPIRSRSDRDAALAHAQAILGRWFGQGSPEYCRGTTVLSEACNNIIQHSGGEGVAMLQKYGHGDAVEVELAISDTGCGIPQSLRRVYGPITSRCSQYITRALTGLSSRGRDVIGQGLGAIWETIQVWGGTLLIRSESGRVIARHKTVSQQDGLTHFPGTHVAIRLGPSAA